MIEGVTGLVWDYFIYYSSFNIFGVIIFGIMLAHDRMSIDKQEKQLKVTGKCRRKSRKNECSFL